MKTPLLLHTCCGPCFAGSYDQIKNDYNVTVFWFNPNIEPKEEHDKRLETLVQYLKSINMPTPIAGYDYDEENKRWNKFIQGLESELEGGKRCSKCYFFRLRESAKAAKKLGAPFTTTLSVSPYKASKVINKIGMEMGEDVQNIYIEKDFKLDNGYQKSIELSKEYGLYRQKYCGCRFSH